MAEVKIKLTKSAATAQGETVNEVTISEPTGKDLEEIGNPVVEVLETTSSGGVVTEKAFATVDNQKMSRFIERCSNVPMDVLRSQPVSVYNKCVRAIVDFFRPSESEM